jgi:hypothetical protein
VCYNKIVLSAKYIKTKLKIWSNLYLEVIMLLAGGGSTVVEHLPHHPRVKGLSLAISADTGRDKNMWESIIGVIVVEFPGACTIKIFTAVIYGFS